MRGHNEIIELRKSGLKPGWVYLNDFPCETDWYKQGLPATVCVSGESFSGLDLRFLVGLSVVANADSEMRAKSLFEAAKRSGAEFVSGVEHQPGHHSSEQSGWSATWWKPLPVSGVKHG